MENTLVRSSRCFECDGDLLWTQNAWKAGETGQAAYRCQNGHVVDPSLTPQCPACGIHDTVLSADEGGHKEYRCTRCAESFLLPRSIAQASSDPVIS
jgi:tRNA(Ile2) C34 agmatinyltransferase TiaS